MNQEVILENITVKHKLSRAEKEQASDLLAKVINKQIELEDDKASTSAEFNLEIKRLKNQIADLAQQISDGYELVEMQAQKIYNYETGKVDFLDPDTKKIVKARAMSADEKQMPIPGTMGQTGK